MRTSETLSKIAPALLKAQKEISFAAKDARNPHFKSTYADLPGVIEAIKEPLNSVGIVFMQTQGIAEQGTMTLTTRLLHESGEWIEDTATVPLPKADPQGFGSANTYARRYGLASIVGLYQDDDDGNAASGLTAKSDQKVECLSQQQIADVQKAAEASGLTTEQICKTGKVKSLADIPAVKFDGLIKWINEQKKAA